MLVGIEAECGGDSLTNPGPLLVVDEVSAPDHFACPIFQEHGVDSEMTWLGVGEYGLAHTDQLGTKRQMVDLNGQPAIEYDTLGHHPV